MAAPGFLIKSGGAEFMNRQKSVFDVLSVMEKETTLSRSSMGDIMEVDDNQVRNNKRKRTKRFLGKESMFKVPMDPPPRIQRSTHFPKREGKWIKYSLADVSEYDLSDEGNTAAALSFLKNIKESKGIEKPKSNVDTNGKHLFQMPVIDSVNDKQKNSDEIKATKSVFVCSKLIMPEYVIGQSKKQRKSVNKPKVEKTKELYLDHIHVYEDE